MLNPKLQFWFRIEPIQDRTNRWKVKKNPLKRESFEGILIPIAKWMSWRGSIIIMPPLSSSSSSSSSLSLSTLKFNSFYFRSLSLFMFCSCIHSYMLSHTLSLSLTLLYFDGIRNQRRNIRVQIPRKCQLDEKGSVSMTNKPISNFEFCRRELMLFGLSSSFSIIIPSSGTLSIFFPQFPFSCFYIHVVLLAGMTY